MGFNWFDYILFTLFIILGLSGGIANIIQSFNDKYRIEKWYIRSKALCGFYVAFIYLIVWLPDFLNDPWITRQCIRGIVLAAVGFWNLDAFVRMYRRHWND